MTMNNINILQLNVRGIISADIQQTKCKYINQQLISRKIDIMLIQEWCVTVRRNMVDESVTMSNSQHQKFPRFPTEYFPDYKVHYSSTECAILYHKDLSITPIEYNKKYHCYPHRNNFHVCGIILHTPKIDYSIYSVYRPKIADPNQIFTYPFHSDHVIIGGDFNLHHSLWGSEQDSPKSSSFVNLLNESQFQLLNSKTPTRSDPSRNKLSCIDLTLSSHNIIKENWYVNQASYRPYISDHFEIYYSLKTDNLDNDTYHSTWNLNSKTKWKKYHKELREKLETYNNTRSLDTKMHAIDITNIIYNTALNTIGFRKYHRGFKPWWNSKINSLKNRSKRIRRKMEKIRKKHPYYYKNHPKYKMTKIQYDDIQKQKIHEIHKAKSQYDIRINKYLQNSNLDDKLSWRILNYHKNNTQSHDIPPLKYKNQIYYNTKDQAKVLHEVLSNPPPPKYQDIHKKFHNRIKNITKEITGEKKVNNKIDHLNNPIQSYEVYNCIKDLSQEKAIGPDKIHNKMIIQGGKPLIKELVILFNKCLKDGYYPQTWNYSNIHPIPKPKKVHSNPSNYRPIAVSSCLGKVFEKILARRLQQYCVEEKFFDNNQCGFQINRCTNDILATFLNDAYTCLDLNSDLDCVFTDFSKAYDSIWHDGLMYKLYTIYEIKGPFLKCINSFIRNRFTRVLLKKGHSEWKQQNIGLPQGSSLSPILCILYTNDFKIKYTNFIRMGCFADDTACWTTPATRNRLRYQILQKELNRFHDWTLYWKLSLNPSKCTNLNIHKPKSPKINHKYLLNKIEINTIKECKYLGLWLDKHLNFKTHIDKTHSKLQGSLYRLYNLLKTGIKLFPKTIMQVFKCKSRPIVEYASIFYFHKDKTERLQKLQNRFIRCAYPCKKSTKIELLHMITNIMPLNIRINQ